jgi:hypothetical protein
VQRLLDGDGLQLDRPVRSVNDEDDADRSGVGRVRCVRCVERVQPAGLVVAEHLLFRVVGKLE